MRNPTAFRLPAFLFVMATGFAIVAAGSDYARASFARVEMQTAADRTSRMLAEDSKEISFDGEKATDFARNYFDVLFEGPDVGNAEVSVRFDERNSGRMTVRCAGRIETRFLKFVGVPSLAVQATSPKRG